MIRVYIAGPFTAPDELGVQENINHAYWCAGEVMKKGWAALCPHTLYPMELEGISEQFVMDCCIEWLDACDYVLAISGWQGSAGANAELAHAKEIKLPIAYNLAELEEMINQELGALANED